MFPHRNSRVSRLDLELGQRPHVVCELDALVDHVLKEENKGGVNNAN